jgi:hypothetical protein
LVSSLSHEYLIKLSTKLLSGLKEAREELNQLPSSLASWENSERLKDEDELGSEESYSGEENSESDEVEPQVPAGQAEEGVAASNTPEPSAKHKTGKQKGSLGYD